jgi:hypothetical protein
MGTTTDQQDSIKYMLSTRYNTKLNGYTVPTLYGKEITDALIEPCTKEVVYLFPDNECGSLWLRLDKAPKLKKILSKQPNLVTKMVFRSDTGKKNGVTFIRFFQHSQSNPINTISEDYLINVMGTFVETLEACERIEIVQELLSGL